MTTTDTGYWSWEARRKRATEQRRLEREEWQRRMRLSRAQREREDEQRHKQEQSATERRAGWDRVAKLMALLDSDNDGERDNARRLLESEMQKHGLRWVDIAGRLGGK